MFFEMLNDVAKGVGTVIGTTVGVVAGPIIGISSAVIATTLGISITMVDEALKAGCKTYEEIKDFHKLH